jgi:hypothetical protein
MRKNIALLSLSVLFVATFVREASTQRIHATVSTVDIRVLAESVPKFDIDRGCRIDGLSSGLDAVADDLAKRCMQNERKARDQLESRWSQLAAHDRVVCIGETYDASGMPPSYVVLSMCLLGSRLAKQSND